MKPVSKSQMERIFDYIKGHPDTPATKVRDALDMPQGNVTSMLSQLEARGTLTSERKRLEDAGGTVRPIKCYRVAVEAYSIMPLPKKAKPEPAPEPEPVEEPAQVEEPVAPIRVAPTPVRTEATVLLRDATQIQLLEQLFRLHRIELGRQVEVAIMERISAAFAEPGEGYVRGEARRAENPGVPVRGLRRYFIVGLLPAQALIVTGKLGDECEIRYWKDNGTERLRQWAGWADVVVVMTKFISHSTQSAVKAVGKPLLSCNGGVSDLVSQIAFDIKSNTFEGE